VTLDTGNSGEDRVRPRLVPELLLGLAIFGLYSIVASLDDELWPAAARHGRWIFAVERWLHLDIEPALNHWLASHPALGTAANYEYASTYVIAAFALLAWLFLRRPDRYRWARTTFVLLNVVGIAIFVAYPVAPPRLLPDLGFVDTVRLGHTWGSWGSPIVAHANQMAAMPSLHIAWALWVSVVLARVSTGRLVQLFSAVHVLVTLFVIMATANHYFLDAVGGALVVWLSVGLVRTGPVRRGRTVPAADAFFLHVESPVAAQHVGGLAMLDTTTTPFHRDRLAADIQAHLDELPRFRQKLSVPSRWRRPRWVDAGELDWDWHVPQRDLTRPDGRPGGMAALNALVAELAATPLPRDRPLWRFVAVRGVAPDRAAAILVVHHVIADGVGTVAQAMTLLEPVGPGSVGPGSVVPGSVVPGSVVPAQRQPVNGSGNGRAAVRSAAVAGSRVTGFGGAGSGGAGSGGAGSGGAGSGRAGSAVASLVPTSGPATGRRPPGLIRRSLSIAVGLAQLATDGRPSFRLPVGDRPERGFGTVTLPLDEVRAVARHNGTRMSDVLLTIVAGGLRRVLGDRAPTGPTRLRVAVPLMVREPGSAAEGNLTAAVMTDLPLGPLAEPERLAEVARRSRHLHTGTRALASNFVMRRIGALMPAPVHGWFARTVYGGAFFQAIVSNMPGPGAQLSLAGPPLVGAYPILPLAPRAPLAVGALGWNGVLCVGICTDPALVADPAALAVAVEAVFDELRPAGGVPADPSVSGVGPAVGPVIGPRTEPANGPTVGPAVGPLTEPANGPTLRHGPQAGRRPLG
jgi:diacylglycerol O-acyltransferase